MRHDDVVRTEDAEESLSLGNTAKPARICQ